MRKKLLLLTLMSSIPLCPPAIAEQPQPPAEPQQKVEQPAVDQNKLNLALLSSIMMGDAKKVEELVSQGADCNVNYRGLIPLHLAIQRGHKDIAIFLIKHGALVNLKDNKGRTPLSYIIEAKSDELSEYSDITQLLLDNGADVVAADKQGLTLAHKAAAKGEKDIILLLLKHGASVDSKDNNGRTLLHFAAGVSLPGMVSRSNPDVVQLLLGKGINVDEVDSQLEKLLSTDIDVNVQDAYGMAPLHIAVSEGHRNIAELLIVQGARLDIKDNAGRAPIHYAAEAVYMVGDPQEWSIDMVRLLMDAGADINVKDDIGWTPLHYAAYTCKKYLVEVLMERGADVDIVDNRGRTPSVVMQERLMHLETLRGSQFESTISQDYIKAPREISRLLYKNGCIYVVAPNGKDANAGTNESPLRTIAAAIEVVKPGDVILVRGGTYVCPYTIHIDKSGEQGNPIRLAAYPGEVVVLDFAEAKGDSVFISGAYWHIKGLAITRATRPMMIHGSGAHHNILEQVRAFGNQYAGIFLTTDGPAHNVILNCDSYRNFDPQKNGQNADGFAVCWNVGQGNVLIGNRAWENSDDGFDLWFANNSVCIERCYAWRNGENIWKHPFFTGNGNAFKLGTGEGRHVLIGCLAWGHSLTGASLNNNTSGVTLRNCTFWDNDTNYFLEWSGWKKQAREGCVFSNNISYNGHKKDTINPKAQSQHNNWDASLGLTLTDDDFVSLDDSMMSAPRNPDGSIPQNDFLKLAPHSAAIDKGADIGMSFVGAKPDLGAFEYDPNKPSQGYVKMLHQAVRDHDTKKIDELLTAGEGINDKDWLGYTPLHWAVYYGYSDLVELLIAKGADPDIQSDTGRFALEIAAAMDYEGLADLLKKHTAKK